MKMNLFRKTYFIYPEIQRPLIKMVLFGLVLITLFQCGFIFLSMKWLETKIQADISVVVDYRVLGPWRNLLYLSVCFPIVINALVGLAFILYVSNRFAGPLFRLERELDRYLSNENEALEVKFRKDDYLHSLAVKINKLSVRRN
jgi:hypothetical protein